MRKLTINYSTEMKNELHLILDKEHKGAIPPNSVAEIEIDDEFHEIIFRVFMDTFVIGGFQSATIPIDSERYTVEKLFPQDLRFAPAGYNFRVNLKTRPFGQRYKAQLKITYNLSLSTEERMKNTVLNSYYLEVWKGIASK